MFGPAGHAYVYFTYGMHYCMNVVTEPPGSGTAVLIRALEPDEGKTVMLRNRRKGNANVTESILTDGPGKLCQALGIDKRLNEADLTGSAIWIERGAKVPASDIASSARVGIQRGREHQWRFYIKDSSFVSAHPNY